MRTQRRKRAALRKVGFPTFSVVPLASLKLICEKRPPNGEHVPARVFKSYFLPAGALHWKHAGGRFQVAWLALTSARAASRVSRACCLTNA